MSKKLQEKADQIVRELNEALQPLRDEIDRLSSRKEVPGRRI
ncbi:MAG TPA: hypothetical protein PK358_06910 [Spirochaetota bacterium]|nr:hypothetical protein [Spirochaetota bacterium]HPJ34548.1 hypothetical protein [Spirochaetota bacterium]